MGSGTFVVFAVADLTCALAREEVRRILPLPALDRPPGAPSLLEGILDLAGVAVAVLRLDRLFGLPDSPPDPYQHLVLLTEAEPPLALLVDRVVDVVRLPQAGWIELDEAETFNGCVTGRLTLGERSVSLVDVRRLLILRERQLLAEFQAMQQRRLEELRATT